MFYKEQGYKDSAIRWRSDDYTLVDAVGYIKPIKNLTLQFGVYNLTDRKYLTWESARSIKPFGTSNLINQKTGAGINRFYSPGRNFKLCRNHLLILSLRMQAFFFRESAVDLTKIYCFSVNQC